MSRLSSAASDLARLVGDASTPVYVLDEDHRIAYCNAACAQWVRVEIDELIGRQCKYHAPDAEAGAEAGALGLCPPPRVFAGEPQTAVVSCTAADGRLIYRRGHFVPLDGGDDESAPVLAILEAHDCELEDSNDGPDALLHQRVRRFRQSLGGRFAADRLIGNSPQIVRVRAQVELAARSGSGALIVGPIGSGKEHAAKAIHYMQEAPGLLVPLDCGLLETNVVRSALRSLRSRVDRQPPGSTLFLENVESTPAEVQEDLLEMLRDGSLSMRIIATSSTGLDEALAAGDFSPALACALSTLVIELPPLARRIDDLPLLTQALVEEINATSYRQLAGFTSQSLDVLAAYAWPGNIDELFDVVREVHETAQSSDVTPGDLPKQIQWGAAAAQRPRSEDPVDLEEFLARVEKELIGRAMRRAKGNKSRAAKLLGLTRPRLYRRLVQLGLEQPSAKQAEQGGG